MGNERHEKIDRVFIIGMRYKVIGFWEWGMGNRELAVPNSEVNSECKRHCPISGARRDSVEGESARKLDVPHALPELLWDTRSPFAVLQ
jgi:hypothetical protein